MNLKGIARNLVHTVSLLKFYFSLFYPRIEEKEKVLGEREGGAAVVE